MPPLGGRGADVRPRAAATVVRRRGRAAGRAQRRRQRLPRTDLAAGSALASPPLRLAVGAALAPLVAVAALAAHVVGRQQLEEERHDHPLPFRCRQPAQRCRWSAKRSCWRNWNCRILLRRQQNTSKTRGALTCRGGAGPP